MSKVIYGIYTRPSFWLGTQDEMIDSWSDKTRYNHLIRDPVINYPLESINILLYKDGFIGFEFSKTKKKDLEETLKLLEYFNAFMFVIYNKINLDFRSKKCKLDPYLVGVNDFIVLAPSSAGCGDGTSYSSTFFYRERLSNSPMIQRVMFFDEFEMNSFLDEFKLHISAGKVWLFSYLNRIVAHYQNQLFLECFVSSFFLIEVLLNKLWEDLENHTKDNFISLKRKMISLKGCDIISTSLFEKVNLLREKRNRIVHNVEIMAIQGKLYKDIFEDIFECLEELLVISEDLRIRLIEGYSYRIIE